MTIYINDDWWLSMITSSVQTQPLLSLSVYICSSRLHTWGSLPLILACWYHSTFTHPLIHKCIMNINQCTIYHNYIHSPPLYNVQITVHVRLRVPLLSVYRVAQKRFYHINPLIVHMWKFMFDNAAIIPSTPWIHTYLYVQ